MTNSVGPRGQSSVLREKVCWRHTPHSSGELSKTTDEAGHTDDGICDSDTASLDVVHREDEGGGGEREETTGDCPISKLMDVKQVGRRLLTEDQGCRSSSAGKGPARRCGQREGHVLHWCGGQRR